MADPWDQRTTDEQQRVQRHLLDGWVEAVASFSPYWRERVERAGVEPSDASTPEDLRSLRSVREIDVTDVGGAGSPALVLRPTEDDLKAVADFGVLWRIASSVFRSGPAGKRRTILTEYKPIHLVPAGRRGGLTNAYSRSDLDRLHLAGSRAAAVLGLASDDYVVSAVPQSATLDFWGTYHLALGASILAAHPRAAGSPLDSVVDGFRRMPVTAVAVLPGEAAALAELLGSEDVDVARVHTVITVGPPLDGDELTEVVDAWRTAGTADDVRCLALWAPPGVRAPWAQCSPSARHEDGPAAIGFHTTPDLEVLEVLTPAGRATQRGGGDLTYTSAGWHGTALVRFQTGDYVGGLTDEPCPACQRTVPRVVGPIVPAAWEPTISTGHGEVPIDLRGVATVLGRAEDVEAWRVDVRPAASPRSAEGYVVVLGGELDDARLSQLDERLEAAVGHPPTELQVDEPSSIRTYVDDLGGTFEDSR